MSALGWAYGLDAGFRGLDLLDRASSFGAQQDLDQDYFDQLLQNAQQSIGTLTGIRDDITKSFGGYMEALKPALDPRLQTAQRSATVQQLQRGRQQSRQQLARNAAKLGTSKSGRTAAGEANLESGFQNAIAQFDAMEQTAARNQLLQAMQAKFGSLAPIVAQIAQLQGRMPTQRERAPGVVTGALSGLSELFA
jgi:superoxide dismutase